MNNLKAAIDRLTENMAHIQELINDNTARSLVKENALRDLPAFDTALTALREKQQRQPDPITGLVPCGCGGKAHIVNSSGYSRRLYVECDRCDIMLGVEATGDSALQGIYRYDDQIIKDWNRAMGYREEEGHD